MHSGYLSFCSCSQYHFRMIFCLVAMLGMSLFCSAQVTPRAVYNFDNLDLSEATGNFQAGQALNNDSYDCGIGANSNALFFDGSTDTIALDPAVKDLFTDDFSLSFYFRPDKNVDSYTLFSIQENCERDSSLNIRYTVQNELRIEYAANIADAVRFIHPLDPNACWHYMVMTKQGTDFNLYVNGEFIETVSFLSSIALGRNFPVYVGYSDCVGRFDEHYRGRIDDIRIYDVALTEEEVRGLNFFPDRITSRDTTLFVGDSYQIFTGETCANNISWTPQQGLDDPSSASPIATPSETTTYSIDFMHDSCTSTDTVRVSIVQEEDIDCGNLLLPRAFTPNNDELNDTYGISNKFIVNSLQRFEIFDRWGMKLFETNQVLEEWDGTFNGQTMLPGTYVYKIEYQCIEQSFQKTGSFNLIK